MVCAALKFRFVERRRAFSFLGLLESERAKCVRARIPAAERLVRPGFRDVRVTIDAATIRNAQGRSVLGVGIGSIQRRAGLEVRRRYRFQNVAIRPSCIIAGVLCIRVHHFGGIDLPCFHQTIAQIQDQPFKPVRGDIAFPPASLLPTDRSYELKIRLHIWIRAVDLRSDARIDGLPQRARLLL